MEARERDIVYYEDERHCPFREWHRGLRDGKARAAVHARITRFRHGNLGKLDPIGDGASESTIELGPGYRIYLVAYGNEVLLLVGGDKSSQDTDIKNALSYWTKHKDRRARERKQLQLQIRPTRKP
jgi:putative addiction module killer protein